MKMNDYEKLKRAMRLLFNLDLTPDDFLALRQLTDSVPLKGKDKWINQIGYVHGEPLRFWLLLMC